jgi:uncharacterized protein YecE (DUF72 family)
MAGAIRVGMSGFAYPTWVGSFYPQGTGASKMLPYYASRFGAVEIQAGRFRAPSAAAIERWRESVPDDFRLAAKANRSITHAEHRGAAVSALGTFGDSMRALGPKLGPLLIPAVRGMKCEPAALDAFVKGLPSDVAWAIEMNHESFWAPEVDAVMRRHRVARCLNDEFRGVDAYPPTAPIAYLRLRLPEYSSRQLAARAKLISRLAADGVDVYVFFRHQDDPACTKVALAFQDRFA